jgi:hypothetical protein
MQQLPPCSISPPAGVRMRRPAVGNGEHTYRWETFPSQELPSCLAAQKGLTRPADDPAGKGSFPAGSFWSDLVSYRNRLMKVSAGLAASRQP